MARPHAHVLAPLNAREKAREKFFSRNSCNPLKCLVSDERIQGNPRKSNTSERGFSQRKGDQPRKSKPIHRTAVEKDPDRLHPKAKRLGEDPREIGLDRRKGR